MSEYQEIQELIDKIQLSKFNYSKEVICYDVLYVSPILRNIVICSNKIVRIENKEKRKELITTLTNILVQKLQDLNPNFSEDLIKEIISYWSRGPYQYPIDIFVLDDAVFSKEATYDDFGSLYKVKTFMYEIGDRINPYNNIYNNMSFDPSEDFFEFLRKGKIEFSKENEMMLSKFISDSINTILAPIYNCRITKPLYELNTDKCFHDYKGIVPAEANINIYLNKTYRDIGRDIVEGKECEIKMCTQNGDDISLYIINQRFYEGNPVWSAVKVDKPIWKLSEEALKKENGLPLSQPKYRKKIQ